MSSNTDSIVAHECATFGTLQPVVIRRENGMAFTAFLDIFRAANSKQRCDTDATPSRDAIAHLCEMNGKLPSNGGQTSASSIQTQRGWLNEQPELSARMYHDSVVLRC